ncbi:MAG: hypothetical protein V4616_02335 [Bacteroidota bacterium]
MKKTLMIVASALVLLCAESKAQFNFGVSPGLNLSTAHIGYKFGRFEPTVSFAFLRGTLKSEVSGQEFDGSGNLVNYTDEVEGKAGIYLPGIGLKYFFKPVGKINSYLSLNLVKPVIKASYSVNGESETEVQDELDKLSLFGTQLGYGVEYFFDQNFSVGGEFGLLFVKGRYKSTDEVEQFGPTGTTTTERKSDYKVVINPTYATISLNFYFARPSGE